MYTQLMNRRNSVIAVVLAVIAIAAGFYFFHGAPAPRPMPASVTFESGKFAFAYPGAYEVKEYASGVASVGGTHTAGSAFIPLIDVVQYKSDLQSTAPASFDAFVRKQAQALCATESLTEAISCTDLVETAYTNGQGFPGKKIMFTLVRKNLKTAAVTKSTYGPIFVFDVTAKPGPGEATRYQGVFVYPTFSTFVLVPGTGDLVEGIASAIVLKK